MFDGWLIVAVALGYVSALFALAWTGDRMLRSDKDGQGRPLIYALSLAVYCTSWTFFGSVGRATSTGYDFIPVYIGPILMFVLGWPLVLRIVAQNASLLGRIDELLATITMLNARIAELEAKLGTPPKTPDNSSLPPSNASD